MWPQSQCWHLSHVVTCHHLIRTWDAICIILCLRVSSMIAWDGAWFVYIFLVFFEGVGNCCLPQHWTDGFSLIAITPMRDGKPQEHVHGKSYIFDFF